MGIKRNISLKKVQSLFENFHFYSITPTFSGLIDTTYIVSAKEGEFILKYYERDIQKRIDIDIKLLEDLDTLSVPQLITHKEGYYLYTKLKGKSVKRVTLFHLQILASFLSKFHTMTYKRKNILPFFDKTEVKYMLTCIKKHSFTQFKKYEYLEHLKCKNDGFIHGDLFKDNAVFYGKKIGVFDFIDGGNGNFLFDCAVALFGFDVQKSQKLKKEIFRKSYNQKTIRKIDTKSLDTFFQYAKDYYEMKRFFRKILLK